MVRVAGPGMPAAAAGLRGGRVVPVPPCREWGGDGVVVGGDHGLAVAPSCRCPRADEAGRCGVGSEWGRDGVVVSGNHGLAAAPSCRCPRAGEAVSTWGGDGGVDVAVATMSRRRQCLGVEAALVWIVIDGGRVEAVAGRSGGHRVETAGCRSHIEVAGGQGVAGASAVWWFRAAAARGSPASVEMRNKKKKKRKKKTYLGGTKCQRDGAATASTQVRGVVVGREVAGAKAMTCQWPLSCSWHQLATKGGEKKKEELITYPIRAFICVFVA
ncbi:hypothetical protein EDB85DRAFT_1903147 [Lactarius pseudohatsudake]|nr:hypothetical protein EDB85DRAFT_1903147 [Lactarius pseudohatsudake]